MNIYGLAALAAILLMTGCAHLKDPARDLLILRATWEQPARQAGVYDEALHHVTRLDQALVSGDPLRVRAVLLSLEPVYLRMYAEIEEPTPEQRAFHARAVALWDSLDEAEPSEWVVLARALVRVLVLRV